MEQFKASGARWVWLGGQAGPVNQYVEFRHEFKLGDVGSIGDALLQISVGTEYAVWLNGEFVNFNQYDDYPWNKAYDTLDVGKHLRTGNNALCVLGYHQGRNSFQHIGGSPGLLYALQAGGTFVVSGEDTVCRLSPAYRSGEVENVSPQLSFTFHYDAAGDDGWRNPAYAPAGPWGHASLADGMAGVTLYPRPNKKLTLEGDAVPAEVKAQGFFFRPEGGAGTVAERMQRDYLSARRHWEVFDAKPNEAPSPGAGGLRIKPAPAGSTGAYVVLDMHREQAGLFDIDVDGEAGVEIGVAYGEQLDDLRVRASVGPRNFAFSYRCRAGRQRFTHYFKRIAGRYVQLHISGVREGITLYAAGIRPATYPLEYRGAFACGDRLFNRIYDVSVRTLELCMHEHYEDTPWREQALYAMDSRNQALCGYYCFGEYDFPESAFSLFAENVGSDGFMEICAPAKDRITIPTFSMAWIMAVRDLVLFSGRVETGRHLLPTAASMLDAWAGTMEKGLMKTPAGARYWNFYEWAPGLDDAMVFSNPAGRNADRLDAPLNLFFTLALEAGAQLARWCGEGEREGRINLLLADVRRAFHGAFWDGERGVYRTYAGPGQGGHFAELTQALALCAGAVPEEQAGGVRAKLAERDNGLVRTTLSYAIYKYEALLQEPERYAAAVFGDIANDWGHMLFNGATSFWETIGGADDFDKAGSLCHGWSAIPSYFFHAYLLGIRPTEPGFRAHTNAPMRWIADRVRGRVPTPGGAIEAGWGSEPPAM